MKYGKELRNIRFLKKFRRMYLICDDEGKKYIYKYRNIFLNSCI